MKPTMTSYINNVYFIPFTFVPVEILYVEFQILFCQNVPINSIAFMIFFQHSKNRLAIQIKAFRLFVGIEFPFSLKTKYILHKITFYISLSFFGFLLPSGPLNLPRFSFTPYLLSMRNTELRLLKPLTFQMSSIV